MFNVFFECCWCDAAVVYSEAPFCDFLLTHYPQTFLPTQHGLLLLLLSSSSSSLALQPSVGYGLLIPQGFVITHNDTPQSVGLLWMSDQLVAETST
jgi:hypothetical protein